MLLQHQGYVVPSHPIILSVADFGAGTPMLIYIESSETSCRTKRMLRALMTGNTVAGWHGSC